MLARVHSLLGVVPLSAYLFWHLYQTWPALAGREAWVDRALNAPSRVWVIACVLLLLAAHGVLGLARMRRGPAEPLTGGRALRAIQAATGALVLGFVLYHVRQVWGEGEGPHQTPRAAYAALWRNLGRPLDLAIYVIGITAVSFHLAHGLSRAAVTFRLARTERAVTRWRFGAGALGFLLWVAFLQLLAQFALGESLVGPGG
jgi:succinate dehydrogenase / fumarate reductase cytochrome b subunit